MSAGIMLINLHRLLHRSFGARRPFLASLYHTQRGVYGFRPREIPEKDSGLPQISALNQGLYINCNLPLILYAFSIRLCFKDTITYALVAACYHFLTFHS